MGSVTRETSRADQLRREIKQAERLIREESGAGNSRFTRHIRGRLEILKHELKNEERRKGSYNDGRHDDVESAGGCGY